MGFLDLIFPKTCVGCGKWGSYLCGSCGKKIPYLQNQFCPECYRAAIGGKTHPNCLRKFGLDGLVSVSYLAFPINKLIHNLKYRFTTDLVKELVAKVNFPDTLFDATWVLTPIPLHKQRQNLRGFNQSALLAKDYSEKLKLSFKADFLLRSKNTTPQVGLRKEQRAVNVKNVFEVGTEVAGKQIVIFDDVWTTGATLKNAAVALKRKGAKQVWGFTLARSR